MDELTIVCPSHGRAGIVTSFKTFGEDLLLCVTESQHEAYKAAHPHARFDVHPDSVKGLASKMTWMSEKYGDFFRVDDDCGPMIDHVENTKIRDAQKAKDLVYRLADMCEQMGLYHYGFTKYARPMYYSGHAPFTLSGEIAGARSGFREGHGIWWPEGISVYDDTWASAMNAYMHRACVIDNRYTIPAEMATVGGMAGTRTRKVIMDKAEFLVECFGDAVTINYDDLDDVCPWSLRIPW